MTDTLSTFTDRDRRARRADRPAQSIGRATTEGDRSRRLMAVATEAAKIAAAPIKPRPDWSRIEDAASVALLDAFKAFGTTSADVVLAKVGQNPRNPAALAAATGSEIRPDHTLIASARRYLQNERNRDRAAESAELAEYDSLEDRDAGSQAIKARRSRLQLEDATAPPLDADTLDAIEAGFPAHRHKAIRVFLVSTLAGGTAPDIRAWSGLATDGAVRTAAGRGQAALARLLRAGNPDTLKALDAVVQMDGSGHRADRDALADLMDSTVKTGEGGSRAGHRAPDHHRAPVAALRAARRAEPVEPLHFRFAHDRISRIRTAAHRSPRTAQVRRTAQDWRQRFARILDGRYAAR